MTSPSCCLIKLAQNHPGIDFIIYEDKGPVSTKVLYFIQVSSQQYQNRTKKLKAVSEPSSTLGEMSPYVYYRNAFGMGLSAEVFYIYSSPVQVPINDKFSTSKKDQNSVYFTILVLPKIQCLLQKSHFICPYSYSIFFTCPCSSSALLLFLLISKIHFF